MVQFDHFVCPVYFDNVKGLSMECERSYIFVLQEYSTPWYMHSIGAMVRLLF